MRNLDQVKISSDATILDALHKLNEIREINRLILFVENSEKKIIGSLTDGDIRRSLIQDENIYKTVFEACNQNFTYKLNDAHFFDLKSFINQGVEILPILNDRMELIRIINLEQTKSLLPLECMIMAGGRGKRLSPLTDTVPKPMLPLGDKPIIEHNIDRLISYGIRKIYISIKYLGEQIEEYFGDGSDKGIEIEYIKEEKSLGTAGALSLVNSFKTDHILLINSDLFTNIDFESMYLDMINQNADMVVASTEYKVDVPYAVFETNGQEIIDFKEKPSFIYHSNAGIYMLKRDLLEKIPYNKYYDITDLMEEIVKEGYKLIYTPIIGYWIDIGSPSDYKQAQEFIKHSI